MKITPIIDAQGRVVYDPDKAADVSYTAVTLRGVKIWSRYGKLHEYKAMCDVVLELPQDIVDRLSTLWCDSKATASYTVEGDTLSQDDIDEISQLFLETSGGHNGIWGPRELHANPDWNEPNERLTTFLIFDPGNGRLIITTGDDAGSGEESLLRDDNARLLIIDKTDARILHSLLRIYIKDGATATFPPPCRLDVVLPPTGSESE